MRPLTLHILDRALMQSRRWRDERDLDVKIAVNLSARCLLDTELQPRRANEQVVFFRRADGQPERRTLTATTSGVKNAPRLSIRACTKIAAEL